MSNSSTKTLKGKALLDKLQSLSNLTHRERAKQCGYFTILMMNDGRRKIRLDLSNFYDAILLAKTQEKQSQCNQNAEDNFTEPHNRYQPRAFDPVLGSQASPPLESVVLGGVEGVANRLKSISVEVRLAAISEALNYESSGLDLIIEALKDSSGQVRSSAYGLLRQRSELKVKKALLDYDLLLLLTTLQDWKIENFNSKFGIVNVISTAYTVNNTDDLKLLLKDSQATNLTALVCCIPSVNFSYNQGITYIIDILFNAYEQLKSLKALCLDYSQGWISLGDISAILKAYPKLEVLQISGGHSLDVSPLKHHHLKTLILDTQLTEYTISQICQLELPALEYIDFCFGDNCYSRHQPDAQELMPILSGKLFPNLKYLGIRGGKDYNKIASAVARSIIVNRLLVLDL